MAHSVVVYKDPNAPRRTGLAIAINVIAFLLVTAIFAALAFIVLASLDGAREKGREGAERAQQSEMRMMEQTNLPVDIETTY